MGALRSALEAKMQAKLRTVPEWMSGEYWAQLHAKGQNKLYKKFAEDTVNRAVRARMSRRLRACADHLLPVSAQFPAPKPKPKRKAAAGAGAAPEAAADDAAAGEEVDIAAVAAAAAETPEFEAAIAEMAQLVKAAKGLSYSVLQATRIQEHGGMGRYLGGFGGGGDSDDDDAEQW
jgi:hypothetical protein